MRVDVIVLVAALTAPVGGAYGAWTVTADGACVRQWAAGDLLRGPTALANAPLLPLRQIAGGAVYAWNRDGWTPWDRATLGTAATGVAGTAGIVESLWWIATGFTDTLTGGVFHLAPEAATEPGIAPNLSAAIATPAPPTSDPCGRPLG